VNVLKRPRRFVAPVVRILVGDPSERVEMHVAGVDELPPLRPISVRPAYRRAPKPLMIEHLIPRYYSPGDIIQWVVVGAAALYFLAQLIRAHA
jgi:hypothetical protein